MSEEGSKGLNLFTKANIHFFIGIAIMIIIGSIPPADPLTSVGMRVVGVFVGSLYLWMTTDMLASSVISLIALGLCGYEPIIDSLAGAIGNSAVIQSLFVMAMVGGLVVEGISDHIGRFILTRKFVHGRPWTLVFTICFTCFIIAVFLDSMLPIFLFYPICFSIFSDVGYTKEDKLPKILLIMIVASCLAGFPVAYYKESAMVLLMNWAALSEGAYAINGAMYFAVILTTAFVYVLLLTLISKFVFRPDVSKLQKFECETLDECNPLPPLDTRQKIYSWSFVLYALIMLVPGWFPTLPGFEYLYNNAMGWAAVFVGILAIVHIGGKPIMPLADSLKKQVEWGVVFLIAAVIKLGTTLATDEVGFTAWLSQVLGPIFQNMSYLMFVVLILVVLCALTNVSNSLVIGMLTQPIILAYAQATGADVAPVVVLSIFFVLSSALLTPAASPFAAIMYASNDGWLKSSDIVRYAGVYVVLEFALMLVLGLPLATLLI